MMRLAVEKAKELHSRYPGLRIPVDIEWVVQAEGCELVSWPFLAPVKEVKQGRWIGLAQGLDEAERRYLAAHALAHQLLHCGNQLSFHGWQKTCLHKQEHEADECAAHILIPESELTRLNFTNAWDIAEHFGVPEEIAQLRITRFATETEIQRWQMYDQT